MSRKKLLALVAIIVLSKIAFFGGLWELLHDTEAAKDAIERCGIGGPIAFVAAFALFQPIGLPGILFVLAASLIWSAPVAVALSLTGAVLAAFFGFAFARWFGRAWVEKHLPDKFRRFDDLLARRGFVATFVVRVVFFLAPPSHWALGLSSVRVLPFLAGSALGFLPGIVLVTLVGADVAAWLATLPAAAWIALGAAVAVVITWRLLRMRARRRAQAG